MSRERHWKDIKINAPLILNLAVNNMKQENLLAQRQKISNISNAL